MLIVGLGNPGRQYEQTRHNIGFRVVDALHTQFGGGKWKVKYKGDYSEIAIQQRNVRLLKPRTYMNDSGRALLAAMAGLKLEPGRIIVVHDELDLPPGTLRLKVGGGHGGHNGIRSIMDYIGEKPFVRLRFGIGHPGKGADVTSYVLGRFRSEEQDQVSASLVLAVETVEDVVVQGVQAATLQLHSDPAE